MDSLIGIDTSEWIYNPKSPTFLRDMEEEQPFRFKVKGCTKESALVYICLMYDPKSKLFQREKDSIKRKEQAGKIAGFPYNEKTGFDKYCIGYMSGQSSIFNDAIAHYIFLSNSIYVQRLVSLEFNYEKLIRESFDNYDSKMDKLISDALESIEKLRQRVFGGDEVHALQQALSKKIMNMSDMLRMEAVNEEFEKNGLEEWNPYPEYVVEKLKYYGNPTTKKQL